MTTFNDILKKSFLESYTETGISTPRILAVLAITGVLALYVFFIYRMLTRKSFYNKSFDVSLVALALITAGIILSIQSSVVISLGMVGALSIVRFRTAIKDPLDLVFLFWAISLGIMCGAGLFAVALFVSIAVTAVLLVLNWMPVAKSPMILVVNTMDLSGEAAILAQVSAHSKHHQVKSRSISGGQLDLVIELRADQGGQLVQALNGVEGVVSVSLLAHDGEVTF